MSLSIKDWRIRTKLLSVVIVLAGMIVAVWAVGLRGISTMLEAGAEGDLPAAEMVDAVDLLQFAIRLNREEYAVATDPTQANVRQVANLLVEQRRRFEERLTHLEKTADGEQGPLLAKVADSYRIYVRELDDTLEAARKHGGAVTVGDAQRQILDSVRKSRDVARSLQAAIDAYRTFTDQKGEEISQHGTETGQSVRMTMMIISGSGVVVGLVIGYLLATFGIARPLSAAIASLTVQSRGDLQVQVTGTDRKDEIGEMSRAVLVFKDNMIETEKLRGEQQAEQQRQLDRATAVSGFVSEFDRAFAGSLRGLASSSTELQTTAQSMAATAEETERQSTAVAAASEQASSNVQTVAAAAEQLSSSITEISRRVTESTSIAGKAVTDVDRANAQINELAKAAQRHSPSAAGMSIRGPRSSIGLPPPATLAISEGPVYSLVRS